MPTPSLPPPPFPPFPAAAALPIAAQCQLSSFSKKLSQHLVNYSADHARNMTALERVIEVQKAEAPGFGVSVLHVMAAAKAQSAAHK